MMCGETAHPDDCMIVSMGSDVIDLGFGASRQWFVPSRKIPAPRGSLAKQRWQLPRVQGSCSFRISELGTWQALKACRDV